MSVIDHGHCIPVEISPDAHTHEGERGFWQFAADIDARALNGGEAISWLVNHKIDARKARQILHAAQGQPRVLIHGDAIQITFDRGFGSYRICQAQQAMP